MNTSIRQLLVIVTAVGLTVTACSDPSEATTAVEANETAYIEAFLQKDLDALVDTMTEDVVWVDETFSDCIEGKAAVRSMYSSVIRLGDPAVSGVLDRFVSADGTRAASTWEWIGTNALGKSFDLPIVLIHEYRDGKIVKETAYYASPDAYGQLADS